MVMVRVRVRVISFIQVKSGSHWYGHAAATTSHPYFGIMVWSKSTVGAIVSRALMDRLTLQYPRPIFMASKLTN